MFRSRFCVHGLHHFFHFRQIGYCLDCYYRDRRCCCRFADVNRHVQFPILWKENSVRRVMVGPWTEFLWTEYLEKALCVMACLSKDCFAMA